MPTAADDDLWASTSPVRADGPILVDGVPVEHYLWDGHDGERPVDADGKWLDSTSLCEWVRARSPVVMLGMSMGKDSLATLHRLREHWNADEIIAYHLYVAPGMGFIERSAAYYRRTLGIRIVMLPNRSCYRYLNDAVLQPPHTLPVIWGARLPDPSYPDIYWSIANYVGINDIKPWVAHGIRATDSPMRRMLMERHGPWRPSERVFHPIWDWRIRDVRDVLVKNGTRLPVDYRLFGRSYDGLDYRFIEPMREHFPEDVERLRALYPLLDLDRWRRGGPKPDERD